MNQYLRDLGIVLLIVFILWNIISVFLALSGCPTSYAIYKLSHNPEGTDFQQANVIHITKGDFFLHPGVVDALKNEKSIIIPTGMSLSDVIPGDFFGSNFARTRVPIWDRGYLENNHNKIWEYNGSYFGFVTTQCG